MSSSSPFAQHLRTNYVPSSVEIEDLRSLIDERQKAANALDVEIKALVKRRDEHDDFVKEHSALLSPIRQIPDDILALIFLTSLPQNSFDQRPTRLSGDHPALVLSQICQRWRRLALNTPLLWTVIDIKVPRFPDVMEYRSNDSVARWGRSLQEILAMTRIWISRSGNCPLTVSFSGGFTFPHHTTSFTTARVCMREIVNALCNVSCRWRSVYLSVELAMETPAARFFQVPSDRIPLLENLYINVQLSPPSMSQPPSQMKQLMDMATGKGLVKAPRVNRLGLGSSWFSPLSLPINWAQLTELLLGPVSNLTDKSIPLSILAKCVNLTRCSVYCQAPPPSQLQGGLIHQMGAPASLTIVPDPFHGLPHNFCRLPRLRTLELRGLEPPPSFIASLDLPVLRELNVLCSLFINRVGAGLKRGVVELIRKFGDGLTDVILNLEFDEPDLLDVFQHLPNVVNLRLSGGAHYRQLRTIPIPDSVLERLTPQPDFAPLVGASGTCLCPKLEKFGCQVKGNIGFTEEAFVRFIAARRGRQLDPEVALLTSIVLSFPARKPTKTIRERLEEMGVDLDNVVLVTAYMKSQAWERGIDRHELDVDEEIRNHQDYILAMGPHPQMLGDWNI